MENVIHPISFDLWQTNKLAFAKQLGESFRETGFAVVQSHEIAAQVIAQGLETAQDFFALPPVVKAKYQRPDIGFQRGHAPLGSENAKGRSQGDMKEFWHIGRPDMQQLSTPNNSHLGDANHDEILATPSVSDVANFDDATQALFTEFDNFGVQILRAVALYLDLDERWFDTAIEQGNSLLRLLHYPPQLTAPTNGAVRAAEHQDINLITLLLGAQEAGLQVKHKRYGWIDVNVPDGAIVLNCGDMLQRLTGGVLPSTTHRVSNPKPHRAQFSRYSMPFFLHPKNSFMIETLPSCLARGGIAQPPILAGDYLHQRLVEIGLLSAA